MREPNIQKNPQLAENLLKAVIEGAAFSLSLQQKPTTLKILQKYLKVSEKDAEEGYRDLVMGTEKKPYANPAGVTNVVRLMKRSNPKVEKVTPGTTDRRSDSEKNRSERLHRRGAGEIRSEVTRARES